MADKIGDQGRGDKGRTVVCPGCGETMVIPAGTAVGDKFACPNCAGLMLRLVETGGKFDVAEVKTVSCPDCDDVLELPDDARAGDEVICRGRRYRLTYEFGSFAAEPLVKSQAEDPRIASSRRSDGAAGAGGAIYPG